MPRASRPGRRVRLMSFQSPGSARSGRTSRLTRPIQEHSRPGRLRVPRAPAAGHARTQGYRVREASMSAPLDRLISSLARTGMTRFFQKLFADYPDLLMKDQTVEAVRPDRTFKIAGKWVSNFGSDSFLGLDQDPRV